MTVRGLMSWCAVLVLAAVTGGPAAAAAAPTGVRAAVRTQDARINSTPGLRALKHARVGSPAQAKTAIPELKALSTRLRSAASVVAKSEATTAKQKQARSKWVLGVRRLAIGCDQLEDSLVDVERGEKIQARAAISKAEKTVVDSELTIAEANRLLGI
jgi:hypothetical protein